MNSKHPTQGVIRNGDITTFTLKSTLATSIELCCFDDTGRQHIHLMDKIHENTFSLTLEGIKAGQRYGYRVHGPWNPSKGEFCNPAKLLLDPYAKQLSGRFHGHASCYSHASKPDHHNSARFVPKSVVVEDHFDWQGVTKPKTPWSKTCIMELHVKGFTARHPDIDPEIRGTYRALWSKPILEHFKACGVTAIELLPVQAFDHDPFLTDKNLTNYWGYMTLAYFAPHRAYASEDGPGAVEEFKEMVRELHRAGIEVILDVVYNHHLEGNRHGPILSLKGIDAPAYYHMDPTQKEPFVDFTGCGNTLNAAHPLCHDLIQTSLKYWHEDMQVDGFRFDEAPAMSRQLDGKIELQPFCDAVQASCPDAKLIAEPWDCGTPANRLGLYPAPWAEWNDHFRDSIRDYWCSPKEACLKKLMECMTGSRPVLEHPERPISSMINMISCHDGFPIRDVFSYNEKHNIANGENNRDGWPHNHSNNFGHEGETQDTHICHVRKRLVRSALTQLYLAQGTPMLLGGDELYRTQGGNNNAYCQDNNISWLNWEASDRSLMAYIKELSQLRSALHHGARDFWVKFFHQGGSAITEKEAETASLHLTCLMRSDENAPWLIMSNPTDSDAEFNLPPEVHKLVWSIRMDSYNLLDFKSGAKIHSEQALTVKSHSLLVLSSTKI